jgi:multiple sugar transport system substrate-binding protein
MLQGIVLSQNNDDRLKPTRAIAHARNREEKLAMTEKKISRRDMLVGGAAAGAGIALAGTGLGALAEDKPPLDLPVGAAGKLTVIHRTEYFEEAQTLFTSEVQAFADANKVQLDISTTNPESFGDFLGKMTAAVKAGNPPDFAYTSNVSVPQMSALGLVEDVTDVVEQAIKSYGDLMPGINAAANGQINGRWMSVPYIGNATGFFFRGDRLKAKNIDPATLTTWNARRDAALAISDPANSFYGWGITPNKGGDGFGFNIGIVQAFGGHFTDESGKKVAFNSPETVAAFDWLVETYDRNGKYAAMLPPGVESWTDTGNNEAYVAGTIGHTINQYSIYAAAKKNAPDVYKNTVVLRTPTANNGDNRDAGQVGGWLTIFKNAPNKDFAKKLALDLLDPANFNKIASLAGGLFMPAYANLWTPDLIAADPNFGVIKAQVSVADPFPGAPWPAKPSPQIDAIRAQSVLENAVGNAISKRMSSKDAVADAHQKIVDIFEEGGIPQG